MYDDAYTRNENDELAVRTVSTNGDTSTNINDVFTRDSDGKLCLRVTGSGGGDQHNKGYFATQAALEEAYPTGEAGDYAIVGSTDTVWLWDEDTSAWIDSDQKGQVTSVNGQTGAVTVSEVPSQTGYSGRVLGTDGFVAGWVVPEKVQRSTMPQADENEVDNIYQFTGTTDANYTNGYFYKCISDGQEPATYSWTRVDIQPAGASYTAGTGIDITSGVISVTAPTLTNTASAGNSLSISDVGSSPYIAMSVNVGKGAKVSQSNGVAVGASADVRGAGGIAIGQQAYVTNGNNGGIAIGKSAFIGAANAIQLDASNSSSYQQNNDANTFKVANANGNYEIMSADGTVPTARLTKVNTTATLAVADWSSSIQTVTVSGVKADSVVFVSPDPTSASDYASAGILCTAQAADSLTFTCDTTPTNAITVNIVCL